jgi:hypothetical protein
MSGGLNLGYPKLLFSCVHRIFGHQFIAPGGEKKEPDVGDVLAVTNISEN